MFSFLMRIGSIFHLRSYPETTASLFTTVCSAFTSGNFKSFGRRMLKVNQKQYGGKPRNKETSGCLLSSQSTSTLIKRLDRRFQLRIRKRLISYARFSSFLSHSGRYLKLINDNDNENGSGRPSGSDSDSDNSNSNRYS